MAGGEEEAELAARVGETIIEKAAKDAFEDAEKVAAEDVTKDTSQDALKTVDGYANPRDLERTHDIGGNASSRNVMTYRDSMRTEGWKGDPVLVVEHDGKKYLVDGHHRRAAAIRAGLTQIPYHVVELPFGSYRSLDDVLEFVGPDNLRFKGRPF